jgi:hypothetical protein
MEKKALADALLALDGRTATSTAEDRALAQRVLRRDRLRVRLLTAATIVFFLLAVIGVYSFFHLIIAEVRPKIFESLDEIFRQDLTRADQATLALLQDLQISQAKSIFRASAAIAALLVSAVCTVLLVLATRRTTLRQIQISLMVLSERIEQIETMERSSQTGQK